MTSLQDVCDAWLSVQRSWLYLRPIFSSSNAMEQIPEEGQVFTAVDKTWRELMKKCLQVKHALAIVKIENMLEKLKECSASLELIQKVKINENKIVSLFFVFLIESQCISGEEASLFSSFLLFIK